MIPNRLPGRVHPGSALRAIAMLGLVVLGGCSTLLVDSYNYGTIQIRTVLESGEPAGGVPLVLYRNTEHLAYGATNSAGEFSFEYVPFGVVGIYAQLAPSYETTDSLPSDYRHNIDLSDGGSVSLVFSGLRRIEPPTEELPGPTESGF